MEQTKITPEESLLLEKYGKRIEVNGEVWFCLPHWWRKHGSNFYEIVPFEKLPDSVKNVLENERTNSKYN